MFWLSTQSSAWVCFGDHVASKFGELPPRRRPKAVPPMSLVTLGSNLGSSLGALNRFLPSLEPSQLSEPYLGRAFSSFRRRLLQFLEFPTLQNQKGGQNLGKA